MQAKAGLAKCLSVDDPSGANRPGRRVSVLGSTSQPAGQYTHRPLYRRLLSL